MKHQLNFPLLVDSDLELASMYGAIAETDEGRLRIKRSTFVIDQDGRIEHAFYGVKAQGHVGTVMKSLAG